MDGRLLERDWQFMLDAVYRINSATSVDSLEREVLECLEALMPCTQGTFFVAEEEEGRIVFRRPVVVGQEARYMDEFLNNNYDRDPYFRGMGLMHQTETFRDSDLLPERYRENSKLYKEIYEPQGIYYPLRSYLVYRHKLVGNISLFNAKEHGDFELRDVTILTLLAPHVALKLGDLLEKEQQTRGCARSGDAASRLMVKYGLTPREREVVLLIVSGRDDREIADSLCISLSTLRKHTYNAYKKLDVNNRTQLCALINATSAHIL